MRYRADYARYPLREEVEWAPALFDEQDARHFDYVLARGGPAQMPARLGLRPVAQSGAWRLYETSSATAP